jgi:hypothetical protein
MIGIDRCQEALEQCLTKWCLALPHGDGEPFPRFDLCEDASDAIAQIAKTEKIAHVFLDFCSHLDRKTIDTAITVFDKLPVGAVLSVAVLKGREKKQQRLRAEHATVLNRRRRLSLGLNGWQTDLLQMLRGMREWDLTRLLETIGESPARGREKVLCEALFGSNRVNFARRKGGVAPLRILTVEYQSQTARGMGVPMLIVSYAVVSTHHFLPGNLEKYMRRADLSDLPESHHWGERLRLTEDVALDLRNAVLAEKNAALALNVPAATAAAWKAHATRGTYSEGAKR